jgi:ribonuclease P protein component
VTLPRQHRLKGHRVFERIYRQARRLHGRAVVLRVLEANHALLPPPQRRHPPSPWRCGVVISAKVSKRAVQRNRLRRRLQAHLICHPPVPRTPLWLLFSLKPGSLELDPRDLLGECSDLMRKAGLHP